MLGQHEDAIELGMLCAPYFPFRLYFGGNGFGSWGGGTWNGGGKAGRYKPNSVPSTGRGGIAYKPDGSFGYEGDNGRPSATDAHTAPSDPSLSGFGGEIDKGGKGLHNGDFGLGGDAQRASYVKFGNSSGGGGSGLFGGGSSFMLSGGGGGSTWVYSNNDIGKKGINAIISESGKIELPSWINNTLWIGYDTNTLNYYNENRELFDINSHYIDDYLYLGIASSLGSAFNAFMELHSRANGNGLVIISKPNTRIEIDRENGEIIGIGEIVEYTGSYIEWSPSESGTYEFILWGAEGGTVLYTKPDDAYNPGQPYTGGPGGACGLLVDLEATENAKLYIYVGELGAYTSGQKSFNGGGNGSNATGGGGSTDIRWSTNLKDRLAVAGGGGGVCYSGDGGTPLDGIKDSSGNNSGRNYENNPLDATGDDAAWFLVNDQSIVHVEIKYNSLGDLTQEDKNANCYLYINDGQEGSMVKAFQIQETNGVLELAYELDEIWKEAIESHWVTLNVYVETQTMFIIPDNGVKIWVETKLKKGEVTYNNPQPDIKHKFKLLIEDNVDFDDNVNYIKHSTAPIELTIKDEIELEDIVITAKSAQSNAYELNIEDSIELSDTPELSVITSFDGSLDIKDNIELDDKAELIKRQITQNIINISDDIELDDDVVLIKTRIRRNTIEINDCMELDDIDILNRLYSVSVTVDPDNPAGTVSGAGTYTQGSIIELIAIPTFEDTNIEWWLNGSLYSTDDIITVAVNSNISFTVKFIQTAPIVVPYILNGLVACFDTLLNKTNQYSNKAKVWNNLMIEQEIYSKDDRGFVDDGIVSVYDGVENTHSGHSSTTKLWHDKLGTDPTIIVNSYGYVSTNLVNSFDGIEHGASSDWEDIA